MKPSPLEPRGNVKTAGSKECGGSSGLEIHTRQAALKGHLSHILQPLSILELKAPAEYDCSFD